MRCLTQDPHGLHCQRIAVARGKGHNFPRHGCLRTKRSFKSARATTCARSTAQEVPHEDAGTKPSLSKQAPRAAFVLLFATVTTGVVSVAKAEAKTRRHVRDEEEEAEEFVSIKIPTFKATRKAVDNQVKKFKRSVKKKTKKVKKQLKKVSHDIERRLPQQMRWSKEEDLFPKFSSTQAFRTTTQQPAYYSQQALQSRQTSNLLSGVFMMGAFAAALYWLYRKVVMNPSFGASKNERYVRDRSLGGRLVKVDSTPPRERDWKSGSVWEDGAEGQKAFAESRPKKMVVKEVELPSWWLSDVQVTSAGSGLRSEKAVKVAPALVLRRLIDGRLHGSDPSLQDLMQLRTLCKELGVSVPIKATNTRDSFYRYAVETTLEAVQEGSGAMSSREEARSFLGSFAMYIEHEDSRALTQLLAGVAARTRALLLQAAALNRQSSDIECLNVLQKLSRVMSTFPLPQGSAEMELVAAGLKKSTGSDTERQNLFDLYVNGTSGNESGVVAEALGLSLA